MYSKCFPSPSITLVDSCQQYSRFKWKLPPHACIDQRAYIPIPCIKYLQSTSNPNSEQPLRNISESQILCNKVVMVNTTPVTWPISLPALQDLQNIYTEHDKCWKQNQLVVQTQCHYSHLQWRIYRSLTLNTTNTGSKINLWCRHITVTYNELSCGPIIPLDISCHGCSASDSGQTTVYKCQM